MPQPRAHVGGSYRQVNLSQGRAAQLMRLARDFSPRDIAEKISGWLGQRGGGRFDRGQAIRSANEALLRAE